MTATVSRACGMARAASSAVTSSANRPAVCVRAAVSCAGQLRDGGGQLGLLRGQRGDLVVVAVQVADAGRGRLGPPQHGGQVTAGHLGRASAPGPAASASRLRRPAPRCPRASPAARAPPTVAAP